MTPRIVHASSPGAIDEAVRVLRAGGLVALPTETVYGLAARALDAAALSKIFAAKGRPVSHPLIAHVLDLDGAAQVSSDIERGRALAAEFWPGPLTMILTRLLGVPDELSGGLPTVAVRAPSHPVARAVIAALGEPIAAPSANRYQHVSPTEAAHVARSLGDAVGLILDGGPATRGIESTVIDLVGPPRILRPGPISEASLRAFVPGLQRSTRLVVDEHARRVSPGLDARHYAPSVPAFLVDTFAEAAPEDGVIACGPGLKSAAHTVTLDREPSRYAAGLYAAMHRLEAAGVARIFIQRVPADGAWDAIRDRLSRATG